jgi:hypothetical protein
MHFLAFIHIQRCSLDKSLRPSGTRVRIAHAGVGYQGYLPVIPHQVSLLCYFKYFIICSTECLKRLRIFSATLHMVVIQIYSITPPNLHLNDIYTVTDMIYMPIKIKGPKNCIPS